MATEAIIIAGAFELAKMALTTYFQYARLAGLTQDQIIALYNAEKTRFYINDPSYLPDV